MQIDIQDFLSETGVKEPLYPGKRLVQQLPQPGDYKSHCVVFDWRNPDTLRLDVKAGLHGRDLLKKDIVKFPVSLQLPTYVEIDTSAKLNAQNDNEEKAEDEEKDEDEEGDAGSAQGSGGGQAMARRAGQMFSAFTAVVDGKLPAVGEIKKLVVMGKNIAKEAYDAVFGALVAQIKNLSIVPVNLLAAGNGAKLTVATPGGRALSDLPQHLVEGADIKYKPKDMFGVGGPT